MQAFTVIHEGLTCTTGCGYRFQKGDTAYAENYDHVRAGGGVCEACYLGHSPNDDGNDHPTDDFDTLTLAQLKELAESLGIEVEKNVKKADLIAQLQALGQVPNDPPNE